MVSQGEQASEVQGTGSRQEPSAGRVMGLPGGAGPLATGFQKCPYLAGRPPCGTHHLFPSGTNVCWAEAGETKPYRALSRETQRDHCFGGPEGPHGCDRYRRAAAEAKPLPRFESRAVSDPPRLYDVVPSRPSSPRPGTLTFLKRQATWLLPLCLTALLLLFMFR